ncbi:metallophosphoesterase [Clostridium sp. LBM24168]
MFLRKSVFFIGYILVNLYIGFRFSYVIQYFLPQFRLYFYWIVFIFVISSFFIGRYNKYLLPTFLDKVVYVIGAYWLGALVYAIISSVIMGILRIFLFFTPYYATLNRHIAYIDLYIALAIVLILIYGTYNARHTKLVRYDMDVDKTAGGMKKLNIIMVSDIHMGRLIVKSRLIKMVDKVNKLKPDILILGGDIIDDDIDIDKAYDILQPLKDVESKYGIYAVYGNHEYIGSNTKQLREIYKRLGVNLLVDDIVLVDDKFYIAGRDDRYSEIFNQRKRKRVEEFLEGVNFEKLIIFVDHQPIDLDSVKKNNVDVQFSGHTHKGQIYPNNLITKKVFKLDNGYLKEGKFNCIVSSGFGTWGPPIRLGSKSEIVQAVIKFQ